MDTKGRIVYLLGEIRDNCPVTFHNFGGFMLYMFTLPVEEQEQIAFKLHAASKRAKKEHDVSIHMLKKITTSKHELKFAWLVEYTFVCTGCHQHRLNMVNLYSASFPHWCEFCLDKAEEYRMDAEAEARAS